jgi:hypothetical protein
MTLKRNNLNIGIGLGILVPLFTFMIFNGLTNIANIPFKERTIALICICLNGLLMHFYKNLRANESVRGLVLATVGLCAIWFIYYGQEIMGEW